MNTKQYGHNAGTAAPHHQGQVYCEKTGKTVAITFDDETGDKARIFAAAPELLAALSRLLTVINADDDGDFFICAEAAPIINDARKAINKAQ